MRSLLRTIPLIGALLISAVPVQAFETYEELVEACGATEEIGKLCGAVADYSFAMMTVSLLCDFEAKGRITKEDLNLTLDEWSFNQGMSPSLNKAVEMTLEEFPECSIKPIP